MEKEKFQETLEENWLSLVIENLVLLQDMLKGRIINDEKVINEKTDEIEELINYLQQTN